MSHPDVTTTFHLVTGEYPPLSGGVGDYTRLIADALAARGCAVHVWCPHLTNADDGVRSHGAPRDPFWPNKRTNEQVLPNKRTNEQTNKRTNGDVALHCLPDVFGRASRDALDRGLAEAPGCVLLQYVPNALGLRGANLPFCLWFRGLGRRHPDVRVMFHEPYFYIRWRDPRRSALAVLQRVMAAVLLRSASRTYISTSAWRPYLGYLAPAGSELVELPIPATVPGDPPAVDVERYRARFSGDGAVVKIVGHFGTYGDHMASELRPALSALLQRSPDASLVCIGRGSNEFAGEFGTPRVMGTGSLTASDVASAIRACDVMLQPYPDGVTTRRTSVMAALVLGRATVTTSGLLTEPVWKETEAVALVPASDFDALAGAAAALLQDDAARTALATKGRHLYDARFALGCTIQALLAPPAHSLQKGER